jgi:DNA/RNA endonuclease YhcR with UshA esterase domain
MGQPAIIVGTVKEVVTLGGAGHKLVKFDGSTFNLFISKQALDKSTDWVLDDLPGKRLQISGKLESYRDDPQIRGNEPTQISRVQ